MNPAIKYPFIYLDTMDQQLDLLSKGYTLGFSYCGLSWGNAYNKWIEHHTYDDKTGPVVMYARAMPGQRLSAIPTRAFGDYSWQFHIRTNSPSHFVSLLYRIKNA